MRASDNRYEGESRQHDLAVWMMSNGARTGTVMRWTGLKEYRVQALSRRYQQQALGDHRRRGISPKQTAYFGKSLRLEEESLALALLAIEMKVIETTGPAVQRSLPSLERGWRLMKAYETYRKLVPGAQISLERAVLLIAELSRRNLVLRHCRTCPDLLVVDRLGVQHARCPFCRSNRRSTNPTGDKRRAKRR
jgi:hypothetical protein